MEQKIANALHLSKHAKSQTRWAIEDLVKIIRNQEERIKELEERHEYP